MKKLPIAIGILLILVSCLGVDDTCLSPDCSFSTEMRFNLIDSEGVDLIFDSSYYDISDIEIVGVFGERQRIFEASFGSTKTLIVDLINHAAEYDLILNGSKIDRFKVIYRQTHEECCGKTFWIENVEFNLQTGSVDPNIGSIPIIID